MAASGFVGFVAFPWNSQGALSGLNPNIHFVKVAGMTTLKVRFHSPVLFPVGSGSVHSGGGRGSSVAHYPSPNYSLRGFGSFEVLGSPDGLGSDRGQKGAV